MTQSTIGKKLLLLIDANSLIHRFFHALPPLTTPKGEPIGAMYGLSQVLLKIFREIQPTHIAAAFDRPEPTFRDELFKDYKAHRPTTADALIAQLQYAPHLFEQFKVKTFSIPGFEADDLIGTLVERFRDEPDTRIMIFSGDHDTLQLVSGDTVVVNFLIRGIAETILYNEASVAAKYGLKPRELPELKGFTGDPSDNIPGVAGIGPKTAQPLIAEFKTVEEVFDSLGIIPDKVRKKLEGNRDIAILSRDLAIINRHAPLYLDSIDELHAIAPDASQMAKYFEGLGFMSLVRRLREI